MIICGFAGIGKSHLGHNRPGWVDLESTPFERDWERYVKVAKHMSDNGYKVLLSCHRELREELQRQGIEYIVAMPVKGLKEEYLERYHKRGNTQEFIHLMGVNWNRFTQVLPDEFGVYLFSNEYLSDVF